MRARNILPLNRIIVDDQVPGFSANPKWHENRIEGGEFHETTPGYWEIVTNHNGSNVQVGQKHTWRTCLLFQRRLGKPQGYKTAGKRIFVLWHDCEVTRVTLKQGEGINPTTANLLHGIWQFIHFKRPGSTNQMIISRPLVEFPEQM